MFNAGPKSLLVNGVVPLLARATLFAGPAPASGLLNPPLLPSQVMLNPLAGMITTRGLAAGRWTAAAKTMETINSLLARWSFEPLNRRTVGTSEGLCFCIRWPFVIGLVLGTSGKLFWTTTYSWLLRACQPIKTLLWRPRFWHEQLGHAVRRASSYIGKFGPRAGCGFISINDRVASPCYCEEAEPHVQDVAGRIDSEKALGVARSCASEVLLQIALI